VDRHDLAVLRKAGQTVVEDADRCFHRVSVLLQSTRRAVPRRPVTSTEHFARDRFCKAHACFGAGSVLHTAAIACESKRLQTTCVFRRSDRFCRAHACFGAGSCLHTAGIGFAEHMRVSARDRFCTKQLLTARRNPMSSATVAKDW
jgi:hypothetical protein